MLFIGIIAKRKSYECIKNELINIDNNISVININLRNIENMKNIKFDIIIIDEQINKFETKINNLIKICNDSKYVIINTDFNKEYEELKSESNYLITYGLNQKATITVSSIKDDEVLIYRQKDYENRLKEKQDIEERRIKIKEKNKLKIYEIMIIYTVNSIFGKCII